MAKRRYDLQADVYKNKLQETVDELVSFVSQHLVCLNPLHNAQYSIPYEKNRD